MARKLSSAHRSAPRRAIRTKPQLLPIPRQDADKIALRYHLALAVLKQRHGSAYDLQLLIQTIALAHHLDGSQARALPLDTVRAVEHDLRTAFARGIATHEWFLDEPAGDRCATVLTEHDWQLRSLALRTVLDAVAHLKRLEYRLSAATADHEGEAADGIVETETRSSTGETEN